MSPSRTLIQLASLVPFSSQILIVPSASDVVYMHHQYSIALQRRVSGEEKTNEEGTIGTPGCFPDGLLVARQDLDLGWILHVDDLDDQLAARSYQDDDRAGREDVWGSSYLL